MGTNQLATKNKSNEGIYKDCYVVNGGYYKTIDPNNSSPVLLDYHNNKALQTLTIQQLYARYIKDINNNGTIDPKECIYETPYKIKLDLKLHQKRTLYELLKRENSTYRHVNGINYNLLSDEVGSGKSLCILSLIAHSPTTNFGADKYFSLYSKGNIESRHYGFRYEKHTCVGPGLNTISLKTNLIIVPHNIFSQWKMYIENYTTLDNICIGRKKDYSEFCNNKKSIIETCNNHDIILIKSTMFKDFYNKLLLHLGRSYISNEAVDIAPDEEFNIIHEGKYIKDISDTITKELQDITDTREMTTHKKIMKQNIKTNIRDVINRLSNIIEDDNWKNVGITPSIKKCIHRNVLQGFYFERVIIDEVDSIKIPAFPFVNAKQIWHITSSINNILYPYGKVYWSSKKNKTITVSTGIKGTGFLKDVITDIFSSSRSHRTLACYRNLFNIVRNNKAFVKKSVNLSKPIIHYTECFTPPHILAVSHAVNKEVLAAFNGGDFLKATALLGCAHSTEEDIISSITQSLVKTKEELFKRIGSKKNLEKTAIHLKNKLEITLKSLMNTNTNHDIIKITTAKLELQKQKTLLQSLKSSIKNFSAQLQTTDDKINGIKSRITGVEQKLCPICFMKAVDPSITPCCKNIFCIECISRCLRVSKHKQCPLCREKINFNTLKIISNKPVICDTKPVLDTKLEVICKLIKAGVKKRFIIFSEYVGGIENIKKLFVKESIRYSELKGSEYCLKTITNKFKNLEINVLLLNAKYSGAGLNLQYTDEIILYHRMSKDLESQVIGRAQRIGRTSPLKIHYLCYSNELPKNTQPLNIVNTL
tara:strand:- start:4778 stop:7237 length:2460 start_codon:yes stop_codon:yes gene_type:complete